MKDTLKDILKDTLEEPEVHVWVFQVQAHVDSFTQSATKCARRMATFVKVNRVTTQF